MTATTTLPQTSLVSVYDGLRCLGFVLKRVTGFEAYADDESLLGIFPTIKAAADAISGTAGTLEEMEAEEKKKRQKGAAA